MAWNLTASPSPKLLKMSNKNAGDQVLGMVSPSNRGFRSAAEGGSPASSGGSPKRQYYLAFDQQEEAAEEDATDEILQQAEKKRRLSPEQVKFLEMSFEMENKLEPERKAVIAKELGLQPRQVAVWFQNRRARWKTKQLERAYDDLKADYNAILKENEQLKAEVCRLSEKLHGCYEERKGDSVVKEEAMEAGEEAIAGNSRQQGGEGEAISSKETEMGSPTKSEQSEVLDSGNYSPPPHTPPSSTTATLVLPAATTTLVLPIAEIKVESNAVASAAAAAFSSSSLAHLLVMEDSVIAACEELFGDVRSPLLFQQVAVKLEPGGGGGGGGGALFAGEDYCNLVFSWDDHSIFPS